ncbi:MAG: hypothetical protein K8U57_01485 [Planctomycetes bacterium]|nr:hypothetical protein [Planctomycetota bacterium]
MTKGNPTPNPNQTPPSFLGKGVGGLGSGNANPSPTPPLRGEGLQTKTGLGSCTDRWREVVAARIPATCLDALGPVRNVDGVRIHPVGETAWVCWPVGRADVVRCLLPVPGVVLFQRRRGAWFKFGSRLPSSDVPPDGEGHPLTAMLVPAKFGAAAPPTALLVPKVVSVQRGGEPKPASALVCTVRELQKWADVATTAELAAVRAVRSGERVVLMGSRLPAVPGAVRFWGKDVLVPVGFRPDPELSAVALRLACGVAENELLLLDESGAEVIPCRVFEALSRASIRLTVRDA